MRWLEAQDRRARREIARLPAAPSFWREVRALYDNALPPREVRRNKRFFRNAGGSIEVREGMGSPRRIFASKDIAEMTRITSFEPSLDGSWVAIELSKSGADLRTLRVVEVGTGRLLPDEIAGVESSRTVWARHGFFYAFTPQDAPHASRAAHRTIRFHRLGDPQSRDRTVVPASKNADASVSGMNPLGITTSDSRLLACAYGNWAVRRYVIVDLSTPSWPIVELAPEHGEVTHAVVVGDAIVASIRREGGRIEIARFEGGRWLIGIESAPNLVSIEAMAGVLLLTFAAEPGSALPAGTGFVRREFYDETFHKLGETMTPRGATDQYSAQPGDRVFTITREGLGIPQHRFELDPRTGVERVVVPSKVRFDVAAFVIETLRAPSRDGTTIPVTIFRGRSGRVHRRRPLMVYGYGGFKHAAEQIFYPPWMGWAMHGGIFATCHGRGGGEFGDPWHAAGAKRNRQNSIDDFNACIAELHRRGYSSPEHTVTLGWSHGGLLVAASAVQRPELVRVVIAATPLSDMVRYPLFGRGGVSEYGDPEDAEDFRALYHVSPYHHVKQGVRYPAFFVTAASKDERAHPMHAGKLIAALQHASAGGNVLLEVLWGAGHHGGGKDDANKVLSDGMAFALAEIERR
jgi:prolyl oligopeptidase